MRYEMCLDTFFFLLFLLTAFGFGVLFLQNSALAALGTGVRAATSLSKARMGWLGRS